ncbi:MAG: hypothetical protein M1433_02845 [Candidatus Parvarchaeota archaeon]|nr:hypothetical protein [Candidatus Parvarchaeota archaeon]
MNEFELDPESMSFTLISDAKETCKACEKGTELASIPFDRGFTSVYEVKNDVQPSKYELTGGFFKSSPAHGYEEIVVDSKSHENRLKKYSIEEIEQLLSILVERVNEIDKYGFGGNLVITRTTEGHGYFDIFILPVPKDERKSCVECGILQNVSDKEIYRTENLVVYVPFAPKYEYELSVSPKIHMKFGDCDEVILFDLAAIIKKTLDSSKGENTIAIVQRTDNHFKLVITDGKKDAFELLGINKVSTSPSAVAKKIRDSKVYGNR